VADRVENVSTRGAAYRRRNGWISLAVAALVVAALLAMHPPRFYRLLFGIPVGLAALNFLEAREKT
jgi:hypothetical protein